MVTYKVFAVVTISVFTIHFLFIHFFFTKKSSFMVTYKVFVSVTISVFTIHFFFIHFFFTKKSSFMVTYKVLRCRYNLRFHNPFLLHPFLLHEEVVVHGHLQGLRCRYNLRFHNPFLLHEEVVVHDHLRDLHLHYNRLLRNLFHQEQRLKQTHLLTQWSGFSSGFKSRFGPIVWTHTNKTQKLSTLSHPLEGHFVFFFQHTSFCCDCRKNHVCQFFCLKQVYMAKSIMSSTIFRKPFRHKKTAKNSLKTLGHKETSFEVSQTKGQTLGEKAKGTCARRKKGVLKGFKGQSAWEVFVFFNGFVRGKLWFFMKLESLWGGISQLVLCKSTSFESSGKTFCGSPKHLLSIGGNFFAFVFS